jgi:phage anti-repressor protein
MDWVKNKIEKYGFIEGEDYSIILRNRAGTGFANSVTDSIRQNC